MIQAMDDDIGQGISLHTNKVHSGKIGEVVFWCEVCSEKLPTPTLAMLHLQGRRHKVQTCNENLRKMTAARNKLASSRTKKIELPKPHQVAEDEKMKCEDCGVVLETPFKAKWHFEGKKHASVIAAKVKASLTSGALAELKCNSTLPFSSEVLDKVVVDSFRKDRISSRIHMLPTAEEISLSYSSQSTDLYGLRNLTCNKSCSDDARIGNKNYSCTQEANALSNRTYAYKESGSYNDNITTAADTYSKTSTCASDKYNSNGWDRINENISIHDGRASARSYGQTQEVNDEDLYDPFESTNDDDEVIVLSESQCNNNTKKKPIVSYVGAKVGSKGKQNIMQSDVVTYPHLQRGASSSSDNLSRKFVNRGLDNLFTSTPKESGARWGDSVAHSGKQRDDRNKSEHSSETNSPMMKRHTGAGHRIPTIGCHDRSSRVSVDTHGNDYVNQHTQSNQDSLARSTYSNPNRPVYFDLTMD